MILNNKIMKLLETGYKIKDTGYGEKPNTNKYQKSYYIKTDTKGLKMWILLDKE